MKVNAIKLFIKGTLQDALLDYLEGDERLFQTLTFLLEKYVEKLLWEEESIKRFNHWFYLRGEDLMNETKLSDEELAERIRKLDELSLIHVRDSYYDGCLQIKIDREMFKSLAKLYEVKNA